jgi:uncharacterized Zn finger protein
MPEPPFAHVLHVERIRELASNHAFERGERYFRDKRVVELHQREGTLHAKVRGASDYRVRIWVKSGGLAYQCECPVGGDGAFCKHCVATALTWLAEAPRPAEHDALRTALGTCPRETLATLLLELAETDALLTRRLLRRLDELH